MTSLPIAPPAARAGTALKSSSPPPGAEGGDFAALLDDTTARTAHAEGPKTRPQDPRRDAAAGQDGDALRSDQANRGQTPSSAQDATPQADAAAPQPQAAEASQAPQAPATPPAPPADPPAAAAAVAVQAAAAQAALNPQAPPAVPATPPPGGPGRPALGPHGLPVDPKALVQPTTGGQAPVDPKAQAADGTQGKLQIPAELLNAKGDGNAGDPGKGAKDGAKRELPPAPMPAAAAATPTTSPAPAGQADAVAPAAAPPATTPAVAQGQPAATPQTAVATAPGLPQITRGSVVQAAERVEELVRIATTRSGNARATLQLRPESLGQVDVHLRTTRDGLVATIAAHDQAGLDALQQAGGELRRQLEDRGVQLHSLDLQLGAGSEGFSNQGDARQASSGRSGGASSYDLDGDEDVSAEDLTITTAPSTSSLVDVTA